MTALPSRARSADVGRPQKSSARQRRQAHMVAWLPPYTSTRIHGLTIRRHGQPDCGRMFARGLTRPALPEGFSTATDRPRLPLRAVDELRRRIDSPSTPLARRWPTCGVRWCCCAAQAATGASEVAGMNGFQQEKRGFGKLAQSARYRTGIDALSPRKIGEFPLVIYGRIAPPLRPN